MRINQYLAMATGLSRRAADTAVAEGRVTIDGHPAELGQQLESGIPVTLDGQEIRPPGTLHYVMLNKPEGYVCSRVRQGKTPTIYDLLPETLRRLRIAGRLDAESTGLVLLSDDGAFIQKHSHPSLGKAKIYEVLLDRPVTTRDTERLAAGIQLKDGVSVMHVIGRDGNSVALSMGEGRNRQIRRTFGALGFSVMRLHRTQVGSYTLGGLAIGSWRFTDTPS